MIFELGLPRKVFTNKAEALKHINNCNGVKSAVYKTVYCFEKMNGNKPDYNSAVINKLFFDFDKENCYEEAKRLHEFLLKENIKHTISMSGRGYHLFIKTISYRPKHSKSVIYNSQHYFIDKLNLDCDGQVVGDNARFHRVPNTFNGKASRFCIPLTQEQFYLGDEHIKQIAQKQNFVKNICIGEKLFDIKQFDYETERSKIVFGEEIENFLDGDYLKDCPEIIKQMLCEKNLGWRERYLIIMFFKESGFTQQEVFEILKKHLSEQKFKHCVYEERQLQYLFSRDDLVFPEKYGIKIYK